MIMQRYEQNVSNKQCVSVVGNVTNLAHNFGPYNLTAKDMRGLRF